MAVVHNPAVNLLYTQDVNRLLPGGRSESRVYAAFQVKGHGPFSVEVPSDGFTADALWTAINARADELLKVYGA